MFVSFFVNPVISSGGDCIFSPFSYLIPVTLNEVPCVALVWPDSCARVSLSKSSSKQRIRQRWGTAAAGRVQPCRAGPCHALGAVVLFTVRLVPQDAVHLVCDGWRQLWKNLRHDRKTRGERTAVAMVCCSFTSLPIESVERIFTNNLNVAISSPAQNPKMEVACVYFLLHFFVVLYISFMHKFLSL